MTGTFRMSARAEGTPCYSGIGLSGPLRSAEDAEPVQEISLRRIAPATLTSMGFQTRRIEANGISYHLIDEGGPGPAVLLLHGFPDRSSLWRGQIPALVAAGFRAIAPDLRGRGQTQAPANVAAHTIGGMVPALRA